MKNRPPEMISKLVYALVPPANREHVLGDLNERNASTKQYVAEALRALPFLILSRLRRTTHPLGLLLVGCFLYWAVFWGNQQPSWVAALIPTLLTLIVLALRDVYRGAYERWVRAAAIDVVLAAACVLVSQAILFLAAPGLQLTRMSMLVGFPLGFAILFAMRLQSPTGFYQPPTFARSLSLPELRAEITRYEATIRRAIRVEIVACIAVAAIFLGMMWAAPAVNRIGGVIIVLAALFIWWFLYRYGRVHPIPESLGFADSIEAYKADLERRRRMSKSYIWWYVLPLTSGMGVLMIGPQLQRPDPLVGILITTLALVAGGGLLALIQRMVARKLQTRIEQLGVVSEKVSD